MPLVWDKTSLSYSKKVHPIELSVYQSLTPLSTANMTLPEYESVSLLDMVLISTPDGKQESYRVASVTTNTDTKFQDVYLEHCACVMGDYVIPEDETITGTISQVLAKCLTYQTEWSAGTVSATSTIYAMIGGMTVLDAINDMMAQIPTYQAVFVGGENNWHVDIVERPTVPVCEARLSRNIENCEISYSSQGLCTRIVSSGLTGGHMDSANIQEMGVHAETMMLNDNLNQSQKDAIAQAYLAAHSEPGVSVSISGLELCKQTGLTLDRFDVGVVCRLTLPEMNVVVNEVIVDKRYADIISEPESVTFTLANAVPDLSISVAQAMKASGAGGGRSANMTAAKEVKEEHKRYETKFEQTDQYFRMLATDSEWQEIEGKWVQNITAYSQIVQTADNIQHVVTQTGSVTNEFDPKVSYHIGDRVLHGGVAYKFTKDHLGTPENPIGWIGTGENGDVIPVENLYSQIDQTSDSVSSVIGQTGVVTEVFSPDKLYAQGRKVLFDGVPYEFTTVHQPGPWIGTDANIVPTMASQITQNATDITAKVSRGDLSSYLLIDQFGTKLGTTLNTADQTLKAEIATAINSQTGDSIVNISANRVNIDADKSVKISDVLFITDGGSFWVKRNATFGSTAGSLVTINGGTVNAPTLQVNSGGILKFAGSSQSESALQINRATMAGLITDIKVAAPAEGSTSYTVQYKKIGTGDTWQTAQVPIPGGGGGGSGSSGITDAIVTNGILTLTKADGTSVTFKKATSLSGAWSSGTYTVTAKQINYNTITQEDEEVTVGTDSTEIYGVDVHGTITRQSTPKFLNVPVRVLYTDSQEQSGFSPTGCTDTIGVDASLIFEDGETAGKGAVNLKTFSNQKKATWIDDDDPLHPATYYISTDGKGTGNEDEAWIDPSDAIDYGKTLVSVTRTWNEYAGTPTSPTTLSSGKTYNLVVQKDGTDVYNEFYTVPTAPTPPDPKVSRGNWTNGSLTFTAGTTGSDNLSVKIKGGAQTPSLVHGDQSKPTLVTGISFDVLEDDGTVSGADTGADITASINTTNATLQLSSFDDTNSKFVVSRLSGNSVNIGSSNAIQIGITALDIPVSGGTVTPTKMQWLTNEHKYKVTASGSITVGDHEFTMTGEETYNATYAINYGKEVAGTELAISPTNKTGYDGYPNITPTAIDSAGYYLVKIGSTVYKKFQAPSGGSGSSDRTATYLEKITLTAPQNPEQDFNWTFDVGSIAHYENPTSVGTVNTNVQIDASAIYQAGVSAGTGATVDVVKGNWELSIRPPNIGNLCTFRPSIGTGETASVLLRSVPQTKSKDNATATANVSITDYGEGIFSVVSYLVKGTNDYAGYVYLTTSQGSVTDSNILAKIPVDGVPGADSRYISTLSPIKLTPSDISTSTKETTATFDIGDNQTNVPISIDASDVYTKGLTDGSRLNIEELRTITQPLTQNTSYTFKPSDYKDVMRAITFDVEVPVGVQSSGIIQTDTESTYNGWAYDNSASIDERYCRVRINPYGTEAYYFKIDASDVYQAGVNAGSGYSVMGTKSYGTVRASGSYTITPDSGYDAMKSATFYVDIPRIQESVSETVYPGTTTISPTGQYGAMKKAVVTVPAVDMQTQRDASVSSGTTMNLTPGHNIRFQLKVGSTVYKTIYVLGKAS